MATPEKGYLLLMRHYRLGHACTYTWCPPLLSFFFTGHTSGLVGGGDRDGRASGW